MESTCANNITELIGAHYKRDIYIIGSGASMNFYQEDFFHDRIVIGLNLTYQAFEVAYVVTHHHSIVQEAIDHGEIVITSKHDISHPAHPEHNFTGGYYFYYHLDNGFIAVNVDEFDSEKVVVAGTPVIAAMHIAYKMGARAIFLCGVDGGLIDDKMNYATYPRMTQPGHPGRVESATRIVADEIRKRGVPVMSILPFINAKLEGHKLT